MSLLMDALRKAEEAKKKAALEGDAKEAASVASKDGQSSAAPGKAPVEPTAPEIELSMEAMEESSKRSPVANLDTSIELDEDDEDYVLPTSVGSSAGSESDLERDRGSEVKSNFSLKETNSVEADSESGEGLHDMDFGAAIATPEPTPEPRPVEEPPKERKPLKLDDFEREDSAVPHSDAVTAKDGASPSVKNTIESDRPQGSPVRVQVAERARARARGRDDPERRTARNVFAAKRPSLRTNKNAKAVIGSAAALLVIVIAAYFFFSLNTESTFNIPEGSYVATEYVDDGFSSEADGLQSGVGGAIAEEVEVPAPIDQAIVAEPRQPSAAINVSGSQTALAIEPVPADSVVEPVAPEIATSPVAVPVPSRAAADLRPESIVEASRQPTISTTIGDAPAVEQVAVVETAQPVVSNSRQSAAVTAPTSLISFRRQETTAVVDPNVGLAYTAYQQGSLDQAEALYRQTLAHDPLQRDALLGLANIAARNGNPTEALDLYSRLLARNPNDPIARAGLMELLPAGSFSEQEAELKRLLNDYPDIAALSYAYGNFLASNQRWSAAQQAYFRALQLAKSDAATSGVVNPDYAFNLAVSLEHLNQSEPAQNYYREALTLAANHPAGFDLTAVRNRLASMIGNDGND